VRCINDIDHDTPSVRLGISQKVNRQALDSGLMVANSAEHSFTVDVCRIADIDAKR
jgi:hypothetical protein